jgi:hypothetical protein
MIFPKTRRVVDELWPPPPEFSRLFEGLRRTGRLFATVHQLNRMLAEPAHREIAALTLKRMGLQLGG